MTDPAGPGQSCTVAKSAAKRVGGVQVGALRVAVAGVGIAGLVLFSAACGRPAAARHGRTVDPAVAAALEVIRVEPVVPFTAAQVAKLVPILQGLAQAPTESAANLAAKATQMEAVFTATQQEALKNMGPGQGFAGGGTARARGAGGSRPGGATAGASGTRRFSGPPGAAGAGGTRGQFTGAAIYPRALATLQGGGSGTGAGPVPAGAGAGARQGAGTEAGQSAGG